MITINRAPIFHAVKALRGGKGFVLDEVKVLDAGIDEALASASGAVAVPIPATPTPAATDGATHGLANAAGFFDALRAGKLLGPSLMPDEVAGCSAILFACSSARWTVSWTAYALATAYLETAHSMHPVKEANWLSPAAADRYFFRMYDIGGARPDKARELGNLHPGDGARYCGRGYVQLTGLVNYSLAAAALGVDLVGHPDLAMQPDVAADIMTRGMEQGWFTKKKLADYLPASGTAAAPAFKQARRIINGQDRADDVAGYAVEFQRALGLGQWG
jgi:putative chitinase